MTTEAASMEIEDISRGDDDDLTKTLGLLQQLGESLASSPQTLNPLIIQKLKDETTPIQSMKALVPYLFRKQSDDDDSSLSSPDALAILRCLVTTESSTYLKPASKAVLAETARLTNAVDEELHMSPELVFVIVSQLQGEDVQVADNATQALGFVARKLGTRFVQQAMQTIHTVWQTSWNKVLARQNASYHSTVCVRCANAVQHLAVLEDSFMEVALSQTPASETWTAMLQYNSDPLIQLSALDLMEQLTLKQPFHPTRSRWLLSQETDVPLRPILKMAGGIGDSSKMPDPLLGGAALRVVAALCKLLQSGDAVPVYSAEDSRFLLTSFHQALHHWDEQTTGTEVDRLTILDAISSFAAASDEALSLVLEDPVTKHAWLSLRSVAQSKLKAAILMSVAHVLDPSLIDPHSNTATVVATTLLSPTMALKLFGALGEVNDSQVRGDTMDLLLQLVRSPMPEVRIAVYVLLEAVAKMPSAGQVLWNHGEFFPLVLARETEPTKEGREAKYAIVQAILQSSVKGLLSDELVTQLETYERQGPHYKQVLKWDVATDE